MNIDELLYRKTEVLKNDIVNYINDVYLKEISEFRINELVELLDKWDKDRKMIEDIAMMLAIEGKLNIKDINQNKLDKEINRILFDQYIKQIIEKTNYSTLKIHEENKINIKIEDIYLKVALKEYLHENVREIFNQNIESFNNSILKIKRIDGKLYIEKIKK